MGGGVLRDFKRVTFSYFFCYLINKMSRCPRPPPPQQTFPVWLQSGAEGQDEEGSQYLDITADAPLVLFSWVETEGLI